jgi:hypothetical protein
MEEKMVWISIENNVKQAKVDVNKFTIIIDLKKNIEKTQKYLSLI